MLSAVESCWLILQDFPSSRVDRDWDNVETTIAATATIVNSDWTRSIHQPPPTRAWGQFWLLWRRIYGSSLHFRIAISIEWKLAFSICQASATDWHDRCSFHSLPTCRCTQLICSTFHFFSGKTICCWQTDSWELFLGLLCVSWAARTTSFTIHPQTKQQRHWFLVLVSRSFKAHDSCVCVCIQYVDLILVSSNPTSVVIRPEQ